MSFINSVLASITGDAATAWAINEKCQAEREKSLYPTSGSSSTVPRSASTTRDAGDSGQAKGSAARPGSSRGWDAVSRVPASANYLSKSSTTSSQDTDVGSNKDITAKDRYRSVKREASSSKANASTPESNKRKAEGDLESNLHKAVKLEKTGSTSGDGKKRKSATSKITTKEPPKPPVVVPKGPPPKGSFADIMARAAELQALVQKTGKRNPWAQSPPSKPATREVRKEVREPAQKEKSKPESPKRRSETGVRPEIAARRQRIRAENERRKAEREEEKMLLRKRFAPPELLASSSLARGQSLPGGHREGSETRRVVQKGVLGGKNTKGKAPGKIFLSRMDLSGAKYKAAPRRRVEESRSERSTDHSTSFEDDASDASSVMEAAAHELEEEEYLSLKKAKQEDEEALREEMLLKKEKEKRKRMMQKKRA
ncbi:MAG: 60S acidic ribosomal protein P2 [Watsoniomyces obsoletus]|nr:MAG: 60S acidic ribosomal protein P2 [Watsoniomyces obsoletus]